MSWEPEEPLLPDRPPLEAAAAGEAISGALAGSSSTKPLAHRGQVKSALGMLISTLHMWQKKRLGSADRSSTTIASAILRELTVSLSS